MITMTSTLMTVLFLLLTLFVTVFIGSLGYGIAGKKSNDIPLMLCLQDGIKMRPAHFGFSLLLAGITFFSGQHEYLILAALIAGVMSSLVVTAELAQTRSKLNQQNMEKKKITDKFRWM